MTELIEAVRARSDKMRATIVTRSFQFEGLIHTPKVGKESRRLTDTLNNAKNFIAITNVIITNRMNGAKDPNPRGLLHVSMDAIEYIEPHFDEDEQSK